MTKNSKELEGTGLAIQEELTDYFQEQGIEASVEFLHDIASRFGYALRVQLDKAILAKQFSHSNHRSKHTKWSVDEP
jgi:hypothetical protein